jgi:hypothetical protein
MVMKCFNFNFGNGNGDNDNDNDSYFRCRLVLCRYELVLNVIWFFMSISMFLVSTVSHAQVQRSFINTGFEQPSLGNTQCYGFVFDNNTPGWNTTETVTTQGGTCPIVVGGTTSGVIELWTTGYLGVASRDGKQFSELNAYNNSALYQTVCINNGETIQWALSHRGRSGVDKMTFVLSDTVAGLAPAVINTTALQGGILTASTDTAGNGVIASCQSGSAVASLSTCTQAVATVGTTKWVDYAGNFIWTGTSGVKQIGFGAISTAGGSKSVGNFLDAITLTLKPYVEFSNVITSAVESLPTPPGLGLYVLGDVPSAIQVPINVIGGTATLGVDYTTPSGGATFNVVIPAGKYLVRTFIPLGITVINDTINEISETTSFALAGTQTSDLYTVSSTLNCGAVPVTLATHTIIDDDLQLDVVKNVGTPVQVAPSVAGKVRFEVPYVITLKNNPLVPSPNVQIVDSLDATFGASNVVGLKAAPILTGGCSAATIAYTGKAGAVALLKGTDTLVVGASCTARFTVVIEYPSLAAVPTVVINNRSFALTATNPIPTSEFSVAGTGTAPP